MTLRADLQAIADVREDEPMARHTTFGVGGPADFFVVAASQDELRRATLAARQADTPVFILGSGSNILVGDGGIRGLVLENGANAIGDPQAGAGTTTVTVDSGVPFASFTRNVALPPLTLKTQESPEPVRETLSGAENPNCPRSL